MGQKSTVEINGKLYDAVTGLPIEENVVEATRENDAATDRVESRETISKQVTDEKADKDFVQADAEVAPRAEVRARGTSASDTDEIAEIDAAIAAARPSRRTKKVSSKKNVEPKIASPAAVEKSIKHAVKVETAEQAEQRAEAPREKIVAAPKSTEAEMSARATVDAAPRTADFLRELSSIVAPRVEENVATDTPVETAREKVDVKPVVHKPMRATTLDRRAVAKPEETTTRETHNFTAAKFIATPAGTTFGKDKTPIEKVEKITVTQEASREAEATVAPAPVETQIPIASEPEAIAVKHESIFEDPRPVEKQAEPIEAFVPTKVAADAQARVAEKREEKMAPRLAEVTPHEQKESMLASAVASAAPASTDKPKKKRRRLSAFTLVTAALAILVLGGYFTYVNMPSISVRVAAARAGVDAKYPNYHPSGYSLDGPVAFAPGEVTLNYRSNSSTDTHYAVSQSNSNWDSAAVLQNKVLPNSENYQTLSQKGLTIYQYGDTAVWVNGGILYTVTGDASLSTEQLLKIVDSVS